MTVLELLQKADKIRKDSLVYEHSGSLPAVDRPDPSVDVERATKPLLNDLLEPGETREKFHRFLEEGHEGFLAHDGDALVARGWVCGPESTDMPYNLPEWITDLDLYWLTHARTREGYRNSGWHKYMVCHRLERIYDRDPDASVYTDTEPGNVSRYTFASTGFEPRGRLTTYRVGHPSIRVKQFGDWNPEAGHPPMPNEL